MSDYVTALVFRYDPEKDTEPHYDEYHVEAEEEMTVLVLELGILHVQLILQVLLQQQMLILFLFLVILLQSWIYWLQEELAQEKEVALTLIGYAQQN